MASESKGTWDGGEVWCDRNVADYLTEQQAQQLARITNRPVVELRDALTSYRPAELIFNDSAHATGWAWLQEQVVFLIETDAGGAVAFLTYPLSTVYLVRWLARLPA